MALRELNRFERAALISRNALHGRAPVVPNPTSLRALAIYHNAFYRIFYVLVCILLLGLAFWEPPSTAATPTARGIVNALDGICLLIIAVDIALQRAYYGPLVWQRGWTRAKVLVLSALAMNWVAVLVAGPSTPYVLRALRPLFFLERLRNVRKVASNAVRSTPAIINVGILLLAWHLLFSVIGVVAFNGIGSPAEGGGDDPPDDGLRLGDSDLNCDRNVFAKDIPFGGCSTFDGKACKFFFSSLGEASIQLFELLAGAANYPNVMMPVYECHKYNAFYFVAFVTGGMYLLLSIVLAVATAAFVDNTREEVVLKHARAFGCADIAFAELVGSDASGVAAKAIAREQLVRRSSSAAAKAIAEVSAGTSFRLQPGMSFRGAGAVPGSNVLPREDVLALFAQLRPDLPGGLVERLTRVIEPSASGLTSSQFRSLLLNFGRIRAFRKAAGGGSGGGSAPSAEALDSAAANGRLWCLLRCCGRSDEESPAPDSALMAVSEDCEFLDCDAVVAARGGGCGSSGAAWAGSAGLSPSKDKSAGATAVANPLALAVAADGAASPLSDASPRIQAWGEAAGAPATSATLPAPAAGKGVLARLRAATHSAFASVPALDPLVSTTAEPWRRTAAVALHSPLAVVVFDGAILLNVILELVLLSVSSVEANAGSPLVQQIETAQLAVLIVFFIELAAKATLLGPVAYWRASVAHKLDALLLVVACATGIADLAGALDPVVSLAVQFGRSIRLMRYFALLPGFTATCSAVVDILPMLMRYSTLVMAVIYCFAIIGQEAFASVLVIIEEPKNAVKKSSYGRGELTALNFNTFTGSITIMWYQMLLNDWPVVMEGVVAGAQSTWPRGFFVIYIILQCAVVLNTLIGFIIEAYAVERAKRNALLLDVEVSPGIFDWRALVRSSDVDLSGWTLARNRHYADVYDALYRDDVLAAFPEMVALAVSDDASAHIAGRAGVRIV